MLSNGSERSIMGFIKSVIGQGDWGKDLTGMFKGHDRKRSQKPKHIIKKNNRKKNKAARKARRKGR